MLSTRFDHVIPSLKNWKLARQKSFSTLNISGRSSIQLNAEYNTKTWHCGHDDLSSVDHTITRVASDLAISPEQCWSPSNGIMICLADHYLGVEYDTKDPVVIIDGPNTDTNRNHCDARGWMTRVTFPPHMQKTTLEVRLSIGKVLSQLLPCALEELGCETSSLDPLAYVWYHPDNFVVPILRVEGVNMVKQGKNYYIIS